MSFLIESSTAHLNLAMISSVFRQHTLPPLTRLRRANTDIPLVRRSPTEMTASTIVMLPHRHLFPIKGAKKVKKVPHNCKKCLSDSSGSPNSTLPRLYPQAYLPPITSTSEKVFGESHDMIRRPSTPYVRYEGELD